MQVITRGDLRLLLSDEGKHIRTINDIYVSESVDENTGEIVPEHNPSYFEMMFLGKQVDITKLDELYVEENI